MKLNSGNSWSRNDQFEKHETNTLPTGVFASKASRIANLYFKN